MLVIYSKQIQLARSHIRKTRKQATNIPKDVRIEVLQRDSHRCIVCGSQNNLHIHHEIPRSLGGKGVKENLVCLCVYCHNEAHNGNIAVKLHCDEYLNNIYGKRNVKYNKMEEK